MGLPRRTWRELSISPHDLLERLDAVERQLAAIRAELDALRNAVRTELGLVRDDEPPAPTTRPVSIEDVDDHLPPGWPPI